MNHVECSLGRFGADLHRVLRAMKIEPADAAEPRADHDIRRIASQPRPRNAVLHHVVCFDHDGWQARTSCASKDLAFHKTVKADALTPMPIGGGRLIACLVLVEAM